MIAFVLAKTINVIPSIDARPLEFTCHQGQLVALMEQGVGISNYPCEQVEMLLARGTMRLATEAEVRTGMSTRLDHVPSESAAARDAEHRREAWKVGSIFVGVILLIILVVVLKPYGCPGRSVVRY